MVSKIPRQPRNASNFQAPAVDALAGRQFLPAVDVFLPEATRQDSIMAPRSHHALFPVSLVLPAGNLWANCKCRRRVPDPQITRAKCADGMIITIKEDSQRDKQHTRGFAGCSVQRVCYRGGGGGGSFFLVN